MSSTKNYQRYCSKCKADTLHVPVRPTIMHTVIKVGRMIVFFVSFGMVFPHIFADDEIIVACEKCGTKVVISRE